jgi:hypothetical protein
MSLTFSRAAAQYLTVPYNAVLAPTAITLAAWVNPSNVTAQRVVSRYVTNSTGNPVWALEVNANNCQFALVNYNGGLLGLGASYSLDTAAGGTVPAGQWTHIAGTFNNANMIAYVNGVQVATTARTQAIFASSTAMSIGAHYNGTAASSLFDGSMDDVRIYGRALSPNEILSLYTTRGSDMNLLNLIANYQFSNTPVGTALDANAPVTDVSYNNLVATNIVSGPVFGPSLVRRRRSL